MRSVVELQTWVTRSEDETAHVGRQLTKQLPQGSVVSLEGTLGAGKSVLVRGMAAGLGIDPESVTSPTFTLWQTYSGTCDLHHLDAYRLRNAEEFLELGVEELFQQDGLIVIEWGEKVRRVLPTEHYRVTIEIDEDSHRRIVLLQQTES
ncbi:MAG: tRNA (adenosine(37)-N6)-threonylcarbamoyltransferase complex ATPase subunit type 1 TsaE [Planctomycetaceae bacterium]|nr:tRNA (adenosine(37)-N6)-threonylcarbamoyltransferase complex ATPase subunit type 1 TsaE [Planctomycetaceae bacterium]